MNQPHRLQLSARKSSKTNRNSLDFTLHATSLAIFYCIFLCVRGDFI